MTPVTKRAQANLIMAKTIAIIGAGPGVGLSIARRFGKEGFQVALVGRNLDNVKQLVTTLEQEGLTAQAFQADVMDRQGLIQAIQAIINTFGSIDVVEYGPSPSLATMRTVAALDVDSVQEQFSFSVLGAVTAVQAVLPAMQAKKEGALLFTTAISAQNPVNMTANFGIAAGAQRNYVRLLHDNLKADNIFAGIVSIAALVVPEGVDSEQFKAQFPAGVPLVTPDAVADQHWSLYANRAQCEGSVGDAEKALRAFK